MEDNTEKNTDKRLENLREPWKKGEITNPNGRPKGQRNYATIYREALIKLAKSQDKEPDELEEELLKKAFKLADGGDYRFYKDLQDRLHGTATNIVQVDVKKEQPTDDELKQIISECARGGE